jgi:hypothetical protein
MDDSLKFAGRHGTTAAKVLIRQFNILAASAFILSITLLPGLAQTIPFVVDGFDPAGH